jgi:hypothetical protein
MSVPDIIIPLGNGSKSDNDELRLFLRSLEKYGRNYGTVWIVTDCAPRWLLAGNGLAVLRCGDPYKHNKDANIIEKVLLAMQVSPAEEVVWTCDDCAILQPCDFSTLPVTWNTKGAAKFSDESIWGRRMRATQKELGMEKVGHFDTHAPQRWNSLAAREAIAATPYACEEGRCINTAVMGRIHGGRIPDGAVPQGELKETAQKSKEGRRTPLEKMFVGYNNRGFKGLRRRLFERFPEPSRWERQEERNLEKHQGDKR